MIPEPLGATDPNLARRVEALAGYGIAEADIARVLRLEPDELRHSYREEVETGATKANSRVAENLYRRATGESREAVTAAIFWLKARAGWREKQIHEIQAPEPIITRIEHVIVEPGDVPRPRGYPSGDRDAV